MKIFPKADQINVQVNQLALDQLLQWAPTTLIKIDKYELHVLASGKLVARVVRQAYGWYRVLPASADPRVGHDFALKLFRLGFAHINAQLREHQKHQQAFSRGVRTLAYADGVYVDMIQAQTVSDRRASPAQLAALAARFSKQSSAGHRADSRRG